MVERMDENVGRMVEYLKSSGQFEDTYIVFMSDNGMFVSTGESMQERAD